MMSEKDNRSSFGALLSISALVALLAVPCVADANSSAVEVGLDADTAGTVDVAGNSKSTVDGSAQKSSDDRAGSGPLSKLQVHGFLTQAWADAKFQDIEVGELPPPPFGPGGVGPLGASPSGTELSIGIPEDGTTNYRSLALQFRYAISPKDIFVVQFASRTLGISPLTDFEDEIELDWAFYERRLTDQTRLKVGRVQIPFGIYNELRDVGTVLPFYRPSFGFYKEAAFTSETIDGLSLGHTFFAQTDWDLDLTVYAGEWETTLLLPGQPELSQVERVPDGYGYQIWLNTPIDLRIGTGLLSAAENKESTFPFKAVERTDDFHASLDATFGRFTLQAEWDQQEVDVSLGGLIITNQVSNWYVLGGLRVSGKLSIWGQMESSEFRQESMAFLGTSFGYTSREELAGAINYRFTPNLVFKAEYHFDIDGENFNVFPDFSTGRLLLRPEVFDRSDGSYTIVALAASF